MRSLKTPESPQAQTHDGERDFSFPVSPDPKRWDDVVRPYSRQDVERLSGSFRIEYTLARRGAERLWHLLKTEPPVTALGALTGNQAVQQVRAGLKAIYLSGWQVAADTNLAEQMYPDQSLYPANSVPAVVRRSRRCRDSSRRPVGFGEEMRAPRREGADFYPSGY
jgi:isocitrate lyase